MDKKLEHYKSIKSTTGINISCHFVNEKKNVKSHWSGGGVTSPKPVIVVGQGSTGRLMIRAEFPSEGRFERERRLMRHGTECDTVRAKDK